MSSIAERIKRAHERVLTAQKNVERVRASYRTPWPIIAKYADEYANELEQAKENLQRLLDELDK